MFCFQKDSVNLEAKFQSLICSMLAHSKTAPNSVEAHLEANVTMSVKLLDLYAFLSSKKQEASYVKGVNKCLECLQTCGVMLIRLANLLEAMLNEDEHSKKHLAQVR